MTSGSLLDYPKAELVFGLVYPLGTNRDLALQALEDRLGAFGYEARVIKLSNVFSRYNLDIDLPTEPEDQRIESRMKAGKLLRDRSGMPEAVAFSALTSIHERRPEDDGSLNSVAYILDSLKRPEEVAGLRKIYGPGFYLIGISASEEARRKYLRERKHILNERIDQLVEIDLDEEDSNGQKTRDTFHLADVFLALDDGGECRSGFEDQLWRFLDLVFSNPFHTPTADEHAMFLAYTASLRSGDLSRQVGAALVNERGDLVSVGCNDAPRPGGGLYRPEDRDDARDVKRGKDFNHVQREEIIDDVLDRLLPEADDDARTKMAKRLQGSKLWDITEYGRPVHAEMEALLSCARAGLSPVGSTIYTTTFPCHNCARHIVAAGVSRVVYVEPYPKSKAGSLHDDAICLNVQASENSSGKVPFQPFVGVGPHRFVDLFSLRLGAGRPLERKNKDSGQKADWHPARASVRIPMLPTSYIDREKLAIAQLEKTLEQYVE